MSLILKMKGVAHGLCHEGCNILFRFWLPCMPRCCTSLIPAQTMQGCHFAGFVTYIHGFTLNWTGFPDGKWELFFCVYLFSLLSWKYPCLRPVWTTNTIIACLCWARRRTTGACLLTHARHAAGANDMNGKMVILYCVHSEGALLLFVRHKGMQR